MNTIIFSHEYIKLTNINHERPVLLLEVFEKDTNKLSLPFINYDTSYLSEEGLKKYELAKGNHLILLFSDFLGNLFTSVRSRYGKEGDKMDYYLKKRGQDFQIIFSIQDVKESLNLTLFERVKSNA